VNPATLAGYGITVTSSTLSQSTPTEDFTVSPFTLAADDRAKLVIWAGSGAGEIDLLSAATAGDNYFFLARNDSEGILTLDPDGSDLIDGDSSLVMQPGDSAQLVTDGANWFSVGMGQQPVFAFDYTLISLAGAGATYTLSGSELNRIAYSFTGALSNNVNVVVPNTYQQYWVANNTTGAYTLTISTDGGTAVGVTQGARDILYCNGANVVDADTAALSVPITASQGGTGQTSYTIGDILYASGASTLSKLAGVATGNALISGGVATAPSWGKIALSTHVSGVLPSGNGGGYKTLNAQSGTSYTLALSDAFGLVTLSNAAAITLTVPTNASVAFPVGYYVDLLQLGAGQVTVAAAGGVTLRNTSGLKIADQYGIATALKIGTDEWVVFGGLTT
jgi:hypothetical protein